MMVTNSFRPAKVEDFTSVDANDDVVGHHRVKPSGTPWAPKRAKTWYGVSLDAFEEFMLANGRKQSK